MPKDGSPLDEARLTPPAGAADSADTPPGQSESGAVEAVGGRSSFQLLQRAKTGDPDAIDALVARYLPALRRWAHGRLPRWARDLSDTDDVVQETLVRTLNRIEGVEYQREGALQAYLRQAVMNRIRDEIRRVDRRPTAMALDDNVPDDGLSPLEAAIGKHAVERYETALQRLRPDDREAIVARIELGCTYDEVATALGKSSADAARMAVTRALVRLAEEMKRG